ncbi:MAG: DNA repair protein RadA [Clostridia bacterium]|nr:DNA repair protein RadA [Clostridia bacterium]
MPPKVKTLFVCTSCGMEHPKWSGKCMGCGEWNTLEEITVSPAATKNFSAASAISSVRSNLTAPTPINEIDITNEHRFDTGIGELNRVLGGGIVKGSVVLLSGDPGIGKSTILLQVSGNIAENRNVLYVTGEESANQLKLRAKRLRVNSEKLLVLSQTDVLAICDTISGSKPDLVVIDSIQTMNLEGVNSSSGSITQVRECTAMLIHLAKSLEIPIIIVGHINKGGDIAGPKIMEHMVDTVLYFEGDRINSYRILRAIKNRFGSTNEIGVFEMLENGLTEVENPSAMLLSGRTSGISGSSVSCIMEGSRPIFAEVQSLVTPTGFGNPRRMSTGFDYNRMNLLLAVLEKRCGMFFSNLDTYLNVVGGLRLDETAADLAVIFSLVSGIKDAPLDDDIVFFGEVGLSGEIRSVPRATLRVLEAERLGFKKCVLPRSCYKQLMSATIPDSIELIYVRTVREAIDLVF